MSASYDAGKYVTYMPSPGVLICDKFSMAEDYHVYRENGTHDWLVIYTRSGEGRFVIGSEIVSAKPNHLAILKPGITHDYYTAPGTNWKFYWCHFLPRKHWLELLHWPEPYSGFLQLALEAYSVQERIESCFKRMITDNHLAQTYGTELSMNALEEIWLLLKVNALTDSRSPLDPRVKNVLDILAARLQYPHRIEELSKAVCLSPSRLTHLFKENTGESITAALLRMRLLQAAKLLRVTNFSIGQIGAEVGFETPFYFSKKFKEFFGVQPHVYRNSDE